MKDMALSLSANICVPERYSSIGTTITGSVRVSKNLLLCVLVVLLPVVGGDVRPRLLRGGQRWPTPPSAAVRALLSSSCSASCYGSSNCDELDQQYGEDDDKCDYKGLDLALECDCRGCECDEYAPTLAPTLIVERDGSCAVDLDSIGKIFFDEEYVQIPSVAATPCPDTVSWPATVACAGALRRSVPR